MRIPMRLRALIVGACLCATQAHGGEVVEVTTYYPSPDGDYRDLRVTGALQIGTAGNIAPNGLQVFGPLTIANNDLNGWQVGTSGGRLAVRDTFNIRNAANVSLFFVDNASNRVGIATTAPDAPLDVRGQVNTMILHGYSSAADPVNGAMAEVLHQNFSPFDARNGLAGVTGQPGISLRFTYVYLDGDPIVFQNEPKIGAYEGPVVINGDQFDPNGYTTVYNLIVGGTAAPKKARAQTWEVPSSMQYKTELTRLDQGRIDGLYASLIATPLYTYRYRAEDPGSKKHLGFVSEESPAEWITTHPKTVDVNQAAYTLTASLAELRRRQSAMEERIRRLES